MRTRIKFCGCTGVKEVALAAEAGADAVGLILAPSPRRVSLKTLGRVARELPPFVTPVAVFVGPSREQIARARAIIPQLVVQLSGVEDPEFVSSVEGRLIKAIHVSQESTNAQLKTACAKFDGALVMFDTMAHMAGGSGITFPWEKVAGLARDRPIVLSGGLTPKNVARCIRLVRPYAVDVRSGVELHEKKDVLKMRAFVRAVRQADET
ncbi:MAG: phosphoribosylanthranilate isomerase [Candidatus Eremiobacteraeota bacterium]|nr:phosphoribosylanthranilate isomerase [Candidatus Eremiobacteraeota bacterium]